MHQPLLAFVDDTYEDLELWYPMLRLVEAGVEMVLAGHDIRVYTGKHGYPAKADLRLSEARSTDFCGLLIPGGFMPDKLRRDARVLALTREFHEQRKLIAFICHGGWIPISARILRGRRVTGSLGIKDDLENAGALWVDAAVVVDEHLVSSRSPGDLPQFAQAMVAALTPPAAAAASHPAGPGHATSPPASPTPGSRPSSVRKEPMHSVLELNPTMVKLLRK